MIGKAYYKKSFTDYGLPNTDHGNIIPHLPYMNGLRTFVERFSSHLEMTLFYAATNSAVKEQGHETDKQMVNHFDTRRHRHW